MTFKDLPKEITDFIASDEYVIALGNYIKEIGNLDCSIPENNVMLYKRHYEKAN